MQQMYPGKVNSPQTELSAAIDDTQDTIPLLDASVLPAPPNLATLGTGEDAETILYTGVEGNTLTGVTRGFQGTARAWSAGTKVARYYTAYDHEAFMRNIEEHETMIGQNTVAVQQVAAALDEHKNESAQDDAHPGLAEMWNARIVEMGENANGTYVRWGNGLQICWAGRNVINWPEQTTANQGSYYASDFTWTFPASFINANIIITAGPGFVGTGSAWGVTTIYHDSVTTTSVRLRLWTTHSRPDISNGTAVAIGRWK